MLLAGNQPDLICSVSQVKKLCAQCNSMDVHSAFSNLKSWLQVNWSAPTPNTWICGIFSGQVTKEFIEKYLGFQLNCVVSHREDSEPRTEEKKNLFYFKSWLGEEPGNRHASVNFTWTVPHALPKSQGDICLFQEWMISSFQGFSCNTL